MRNTINPVLAIKLELTCTYYLTEQEYPLGLSKKLDWKLGTCLHACILFFFFPECSSRGACLERSYCKPRNFGVVKVMTDWKRPENNDSRSPLWLTAPFIQEKYHMCKEQSFYPSVKCSCFEGKMQLVYFVSVSGPDNRLVRDTGSPGFWWREGKSVYCVPK